MKPESGNLTASESLDLISAMIQEAKGNVRRNSFFFLFWGWVVITANVSMYVLGLAGYAYPSVAWAITIPAWVITIYKMSRIKGKARSASHFDRITGWLWISFGITVFIIAFFGSRINFQINPLVLLITAIPTVVSGIILKFRPLVVGALVFWISGITCLLLPLSLQPLVSAVGTACGYLIPGYMLKNRKDEDV